MKEPRQPHYSMLQDTMLHLKQRKGASLAQIRKHLEANYDSKLDDTNKKMLSSALKGLVQTGKVEKSGGVYKLSKGGGAESELDIPNRRRRALPHGRRKTHRRHHKKRHHRRRRRRRALSHGRCKKHRRYHKKRHRRRRSRRRHGRRRHHRRRRCHRRRRSRH